MREIFILGGNLRVYKDSIEGLITVGNPLMTMSWNLDDHNLLVKEHIDSNTGEHVRVLEVVDKDTDSILIAKVITLTDELTRYQDKLEEFLISEYKSLLELTKTRKFTMKVSLRDMRVLYEEEVQLEGECLAVLKGTKSEITLKIFNTPVGSELEYMYFNEVLDRFETVDRASLWFKGAHLDSEKELEEAMTKALEYYDRYYDRFYSEKCKMSKSSTFSK